MPLESQSIRDWTLHSGLMHEKADFHSPKARANSIQPIPAPDLMFSFIMLKLSSGSSLVWGADFFVGYFAFLT